MELRTAEANLPPDAIFVLGAVPLLQKFSRAADLNAIWLRHRADYQALVAQLHKPVNDTLLGMDYYLQRTPERLREARLRGVRGTAGGAGRDQLAQLRGRLLPGAVAFGDLAHRGWTRCGIPICTTFWTPWC